MVAQNAMIYLLLRTRAFPARRRAVIAHRSVAIKMAYKASTARRRSSIKLAQRLCCARPRILCAHSFPRTLPLLLLRRAPLRIGNAARVCVPLRRVFTASRTGSAAQVARRAAACYRVITPAAQHALPRLGA